MFSVSRISKRSLFCRPIKINIKRYSQNISFKKDENLSLKLKNEFACENCDFFAFNNLKSLSDYGFLKNPDIEPKENSKEFSIWPNPKVKDFSVEIFKQCIIRGHLDSVMYLF